VPRGVLISASAAALAALAVAAPSALAAPGAVTDSEFTGGTADANTAVVAGNVQLARKPSTEEFDGATLPTGMASTPWAAGGAGTVAAGALSVDGTLISDQAALSGPQTLRFRAKFGAEHFEHAGLGVGLGENEPFAIFSTNNTTDTLWARTSVPGGAAENTPLALDPTIERDYRIEWTPTQVQFYVDNVLFATHPIAITASMRPIFSDADVGGQSLSVASTERQLFPASGTFTSAPLDAGDARAAWGTLNATGSGASVSYETRTGNTATPDASWSAFQALGANDAVQSPMGRYIQYRATLSTSDATVTPGVEQVAIGYDIDDVKPVARIDGVDVSGTTASVGFASADSDLARLECSLDGGAFVTCTSPKAFGALAPGAHTVAVRAVDKAGNVGDAATRGFSIAASPGGGGGTTAPPSGGGTAQPPAHTVATAVAVSLAKLNVRASKGGVVKLQLKCLRGEQRCTIELRLKRAGKVVAAKSVRIDSGATRTVSLRLSKSARRALAAKRSLKLKASLAARDSAGNVKSITRTLTVKAPR
jgi:hypothetical protein